MSHPTYLEHLLHIASTSELTVISKGGGATGLKPQLEETGLSAQTCSQLLEHGMYLFQKTMEAAPLLKPSALRLSTLDGSKPCDVAASAAELLAAHAKASEVDAADASYIQQPIPQSSPAPPGSAQPHPLRQDLLSQSCLSQDQSSQIILCQEQLSQRRLSQDQSSRILLSQC